MKQDTYEHADSNNCYIHNVVFYQKQVYGHLIRESDGKESIHELGGGNQFKVGQQLDTSKLPRDRDWKLTANQSYVVLVSCSDAMSGTVKSVHLFKGNKQVQQLKMCVKYYALRAVVTNSNQLLLLQKGYLSLAIIDLDKWDKKSAKAKRVIQVMHKCFSFCWLEESNSSGYLVAAEVPNSYTNVYIYKVDLDSVQEREALAVMRKVDLALTHLYIDPGNGKVLLVRGETIAQNWTQRQPAFIAFNF